MSEDLSATIDKTIGYIRKNGPSFEARLRDSGNPRFSFLDPKHEHHQAYLDRLKAHSGEPGAPGSDIEVTENVPEARRLVFMPQQVPLSRYDLDVLKLAAMFVARNGPEYAAKLLSHEQGAGNGAQFGFLDKRHSLHAHFMAYVHQYRLTIAALRPNTPQTWPENKLGDTFESDVKLVAALLEPDYSVVRDAYRRAFHRKQKRVKTRNKKVAFQQRQARFASIDWQDFALVGKLEFDAIDEVSVLPAPLTREEVLYRGLNTRSNDVLSSRKRPAEEPEPEPEQPTPLEHKVVIPGMKIRAAGESRLRKQPKQEPKIKCPITGSMVPELEFDSHLKTLLRDPRYQEQQENYMRKHFKHASNLTTDQVYDNIRRLARQK